MHHIHSVLICNQPEEIKICFEIKLWVLQNKIGYMY